MLTRSSAQPDQFLAGAFANRDNEHDPALKFLHGTTTLGFVFSKGIIITVDSRASMGSYVGEESVLVLCALFGIRRMCLAGFYVRTDMPRWLKSGRDAESAEKLRFAVQISFK
jgi:20S proteasome alpha/beta subunit